MPHRSRQRAAFLLAAALLALASLAWAQDPPYDSLKKGTWEFGVWTGGGTAFRGIGTTLDTRIWNAGFRVGRVLTGEHGAGPLRGHFEWAADVVPAYVVFQHNTVYGAGFTPLVLKWVFKSRRRVVPYAELAGGVIFSSTEVPPGTSTVNFTPQASFGLHIFTSRRRAVGLGARWLHMSNAGLVRANPGVDTVQFTLGYSWFK